MALKPPSKEELTSYETPTPETYDPKKYWGHKHHSQYGLSKPAGKKG